MALKLGLAGGPLVVAIILARIGSLGKLYWFMPPSANLALREIGIVLFLAVVGIKAGGHFFHTLLSQDGVSWLGYGAIITIVPLLVVGMLARGVGKMNYLTLCGLLSGAMTDPPALAFANGIKEDSGAPRAGLCHRLPAGDVHAHHPATAAGRAAVGRQLRIRRQGRARPGIPERSCQRE